MEISLDNWLLWQWGPVHLNATLAYTWLVMALLTCGSWLVTRRLVVDPPLSHWQNLLEAIIAVISDQIQQISQQPAGHFLPFIGTLFIFISFANMLAIIPGYHPPTDSLSTTAALALCVLVAVPLFGISQQGLRTYLQHYLQPTFFMLPFHLISEFSPHPGSGGPALRQCHERCHAGGYPPGRGAVVFPCGHAAPGTLNRANPSLYFCSFGHGLYRLGHAGAC